MIRDVEGLVAWQGRGYTGIKELGFNDRGTFVVSLHTTEPGDPRGGYFTMVPISPKEHRLGTGYGDNGPRAAVRDYGDHLIIYDDWRKRHELVASRPVLEALLAEFAEQSIPLENK